MALGRLCAESNIVLENLELLCRNAPPFDIQRYKELKAQDLSQRAIAEQMGMPEATLRNNLKVLAQSVGAGIPTGDQGLPGRENAEASHEGPPEEALVLLLCISTRGCLTIVRESVVGGEDIEGSQAIPALPSQVYMVSPKVHLEPG